MTEQRQPINLVNQVASAISCSADPDNPGSPDNWKPEAYAAVRAVADWLNDQNNGIPSWTYLQLQKELDQYDQNSIVPSSELVKKWQREANHNEPMFPQVAAMAAAWGYQQHEKELANAMNFPEHNPTKHTMTDLSAAYRKIAEGTFLAQDRDSNFPGENSIPSQPVGDCNQDHTDKLPSS